ncbi:3-phenylpropionate-dihydrodiol/cinnamic acid-dihydrodiol dehydrogenase [Streptomyces canarius]
MPRTTDPHRTPHAEYEGLVAVVTGGASGIGLATARELHARGAEVAVLDLAATDEPFLHVHCDVTDDEAVRTAVDTVTNELGDIHVLVNNAGIGAQGTVEDNTPDEWRRVLDVNVIGIARVTTAALPALRKAAAGGAGHAAIVNMCSIAATAGLPRRALYSASKGAVLALTRAMAADHLREGIRVCCVNPGTVDTPWVGRLPQPRTTPTQSAPPWRPASRADDWSAPRKSPPPSPTWPAPARAPPRARTSRSTAGCRD